MRGVPLTAATWAISNRCCSLLCSVSSQANERSSDHESVQPEDDGDGVWSLIGRKHNSGSKDFSPVNFFVDVPLNGKQVEA